MGKAPFRRTWASVDRPDDSPKRYISRILEASRFSAGLFPLHSPLLRESLLVSFPPLNYMLKFGGYSYKAEIRLENIGLWNTYI